MTLRADAMFMFECLTLAEKGGEAVRPNPMVGAVVVRSGRVIGRGYHRKFGSAHAEVNAILSARTSVKGATLYVNLEPCNFTGKTPPCTDLIIRSGIGAVVVGTKDPNPKINGKGIARLRRAGVKVRSGVLEEECERLNEVFFKQMRTGLPFVTLKIAQTIDGKIADAGGNGRWITGKASRDLVHRLRSQHDAVLVGCGTVNQDNPRLTARIPNGRNPLRVILDGELNVNPRARVLSGSPATVLVACTRAVSRRPRKREELLRKGVKLIELPCRNGKVSLEGVLKRLSAMGIGSVLVEGGATVFGSFLNQNLADKIVFFLAPKILGDGLNGFSNLRRVLGKEIRLHGPVVRALGADILVEAYLH